MVKDKDFVAETTKQTLELVYVDGEEMQKLYERLAQSPKAMIDRIKERPEVTKHPVVKAKIELQEATAGIERSNAASLPIFQFVNNRSGRDCAITRTVIQRFALIIAYTWRPRIPVSVRSNQVLTQQNLDIGKSRPETEAENSRGCRLTLRTFRLRDFDQRPLTRGTFALIFPVTEMPRETGDVGRWGARIRTWKCCSGKRPLKCREDFA